MNLVTEQPREPPTQSASKKIILPEDKQYDSAPRPHSNPQTISLVIIATGVIFAILYAAKAVLFPSTLALFIAFPLRPIIRVLQRLYAPRFLSVPLVMIAFLAVLLLGIYWLSTPASEWVNNAPQKLRRVESKLRALSRPMKEINEASARMEEMADNSSNSGAIEVEVRRPHWSSTILAATGDFAISGVIALSAAFLLLVFGDGLIRSIVDVLPTRIEKRYLVQVCFDVEQTVSRYLLTYTLINMCLGAVIGTGLWLLGIPNPILWGVMAAILNYIPFQSF